MKQIKNKNQPPYNQSCRMLGSRCGQGKIGIQLQGRPPNPQQESKGKEPKGTKPTTYYYCSCCCCCSPTRTGKEKGRSKMERKKLVVDLDRERRELERVGMELQDQTHHHLHHPIIIEAKRWESKREGVGEESRVLSLSLCSQKNKLKKWEEKSRDTDCSRWPSKQATNLSFSSHTCELLLAQQQQPPQLPARKQEEIGARTARTSQGRRR